MRAAIAFLAVALWLPAAAHAVKPVNQSLFGTAIEGADPVAYFTDGVPMIGSAKHTSVHEGAAYRFVSESNRKRFESSPADYLPQYGGFCAYGVSVGKKFDGDPRVFKVVDDKLFFNLNPEIKATWTKDIPGNVRKADRNWERIRDRAARSL